MHPLLLIVLLCLLALAICVTLLVQRERECVRLAAARDAAQADVAALQTRELHSAVITVRTEELFDLVLADGNVYVASRYAFHLACNDMAVQVIVRGDAGKNHRLLPGDVWEMAFTPSMSRTHTAQLPPPAETFTPKPAKPTRPPGVVVPLRPQPPEA